MSFVLPRNWRCPRSITLGAAWMLCLVRKRALPQTSPAQEPPSPKTVLTAPQRNKAGGRGEVQGSLCIAGVQMPRSQSTPTFKPLPAL